MLKLQRLRFVVLFCHSVFLYEGVKGLTCVKCATKYPFFCNPGNTLTCPPGSFCQSIYHYGRPTTTIKGCVSSCDNPYVQTNIANSIRYCCDTDNCNSGTIAPPSPTTAATTTAATTTSAMTTAATTTAATTTYVMTTAAATTTSVMTSAATTSAMTTAATTTSAITTAAETTAATTTSAITTAAATTAATTYRLTCVKCATKYPFFCSASNTEICPTGYFCQSTYYYGNPQSIIKGCVSTCAYPNVQTIVSKTVQYCCDTDSCNSGTNAPTSTDSTTAATPTTTTPPIQCYSCSASFHSSCSTSSVVTCSPGQACRSDSSFKPFSVAKGCIPNSQCPVPDVTYTGSSYIRYCCFSNLCNQAQSKSSSSGR